jgi:predicted DCC family thiol-disulfide oxidoreductase YuxK
MPTLVYDGDCGFCTRSLALIPRRARRTTQVVAYQQADLGRLGLTTEQCVAAAQWVADDGRQDSGHAAIARVLQQGGGLWRLVGTTMLVPPVSWLAAGVYALVARNRMRLPGGTPACAAPRDDRPAA